MYFLADLLTLDDLKTLALNKFISDLKRLWVSEGLVDCIVEIYNNTCGANDLKAAIVRALIEHRKELLHKPAFEALLFSIYCVALKTIALEDDIEAIFGASKALSHLHPYTPYGAEQPDMGGLDRRTRSVGAFNVAY